MSEMDKRIVAVLVIYCLMGTWGWWWDFKGWWYIAAGIMTPLAVEAFRLWTGHWDDSD